MSSEATATDYNENPSQYLREFRERNGMTWGALSKHLNNTPVRTLHAWASGERVPPRCLKNALEALE